MTHFLRRNDSFLLLFTIYARKSHRKPQRILQLVCEDGVLLLAWFDRRFSLCGQQRPKCELATHLVCPPFFSELSPFIQPHKAKSDWFRSADSNIYFCISRISHMFIWTFFFHNVRSCNVPKLWIILYMTARPVLDNSVYSLEDVPVRCPARGIILFCHEGQNASGAHLPTGTFPEAVNQWVE